jgi:hypothetical protein
VPAHCTREPVIAIIIIIIGCERHGFLKLSQRRRILLFFLAPLRIGIFFLLLEFGEFLWCSELLHNVRKLLDSVLVGHVVFCGVESCRRIRVGCRMLKDVESPRATAYISAHGDDHKPTVNRPLEPWRAL